MESEMQELIREYVRNGHGAVAYIGLDNHKVFLADGALKEVELFTDDHSHQMVCTATNDHPVLTGVKSVLVVGSSAITEFEGERLEPLLTSSEKFSFSGNGTTAFAWNYGSGRLIIATTELPIGSPAPTNLGAHDTERFAINLDQWLAGYPVFGSSTSSTTSGDEQSKPRLDSISLKNGDTVSGYILNEKISIKTSYARLSFTVPEVKQIKVEGSGATTDIILLNTGDRLSGVLQEQKLSIKLSSGNVVEIQKDKLKEINIAPR
jgi:hypothetical protein